MADYAETVTNWARTIEQRPRRVVTPGSLYELGQAIAETTAAGRHARALGSVWSFSQAVVTPDVAISTAKLGAVLGVARAPWSAAALSRALAPGARRDGRAYVYVQSGATLRVVLAELAKLGLSIGSMGSSAGQRVGGLLATGSHGADFDLPPAVDYVRAIHLVCADGSQRWLERASEPLTTDEGVLRVAEQLERAEIIRDDATFDACLVSVGSVGVVYALVLEVRDPRYALAEATAQVPWRTVRAALADGTAFETPLVPRAADPAAGESARYRYLELLFNPYPHTSGDVLVRVVTRFEARTPTDRDYVRPPRRVSVLDKLRVFAGVKSKDDAHYHDIIEELQSENRVTTSVFAPSAAINDTGSDTAVPVQSMELCMSTRGNVHLALLDDLLEAFERRRKRGQDFAGFWAVRFTRPSRATLAMQVRGDGDAADQRFMHVEVFALQRLDLLASRPTFADPTRLEGDNAAFVADFGRLAAQHGARLHWGQWAPPGLAHSASAYVGRASFLAVKRKLAGTELLGAATFDSDFTVQSGLAALRPGWSAVSAMPTMPSTAPFDTRALRLEAPSACTDPSGRAWLLAVNGDGRVSGAALGAAWSPAGQRTDRVVEGRLAVALDEGKPIIVARFDDGRLRAFRVAHPDAPWVDLGIRNAEGSPVVLTDGGDLRTILTIAGDFRTLRAATPSGTGASSWSDLGAFSVPIDGSPAATRDAGGHLIVVGRAGGEVRMLEIAPSGTRTESNLGLGTLVDPTIVATATGVLVLGVDVRRPVAMWRANGGAFEETTIPGAAAALAGTRLAALVRGAEVLVGFTDADGQVQRRSRSSTGWRSRPAIPASAVSGPALTTHRTTAGGEVVVIATRFAHDVVQTATEALS
jgi:hypothetical protein